MILKSMFIFTIIVCSFWAQGASSSNRIPGKCPSFFISKENKEVKATLSQRGSLFLSDKIRKVKTKIKHRRTLFNKKSKLNKEVHVIFNTIFSLTTVILRESIESMASVDKFYRQLGISKLSPDLSYKLSKISNDNLETAEEFITNDRITREFLKSLTESEVIELTSVISAGLVSIANKYNSSSDYKKIELLEKMYVSKKKLEDAITIINTLNIYEHTLENFIRLNLNYIIFLRKEKQDHAFMFYLNVIASVLPAGFFGHFVTNLEYNLLVPSVVIYVSSYIMTVIVNYKITDLFINKSFIKEQKNKNEIVDQLMINTTGLTSLSEVGKLYSKSMTQNVSLYSESALRRKSKTIINLYNSEEMSLNLINKIQKELRALLAFVQDSIIILNISDSLFKKEMSALFGRVKHRGNQSLDNLKLTIERQFNFFNDLLFDLEEIKIYQRKLNNTDLEYYDSEGSLTKNIDLTTALLDLSKNLILERIYNLENQLKVLKKIEESVEFSNLTDQAMHIQLKLDGNATETVESLLDTIFKSEVNVDNDLQINTNKSHKSQNQTK